MNSETVEDLTTFISPGTTIKGDMTFTAPVRIAGRIEGIIHAEDLLELTAEGIVEGDIHGTFVDIQGTVKGTITASKSCRLNASARINGELRAANLAISEGASFVGKVYVGGEAPDDSQEQAAEQPTRAAEPAPQPIRTQFAPESPTPVSVLQNRLEQMAVEAEQVAVAAHMSTNGQQEPQVRINTAAVQNTLNRQPRIIKATR